MACETVLTKVVKLASDFVCSKGGTWGHDDWEGFCADAAKIGVEISPENSVALGNLLESIRYFQQISPPATVKKTAVKKKPCKKAD